jgi:hypothetical protein
MSRLLAGQPSPNQIETVLKAEVISLALLFEFDFVSGVVRLSNMNIPFTDPQGNIWEGLGELVQSPSFGGGVDELASYVEYELAIPKEFTEGADALSKSIPEVLRNKSEYVNRKATMYACVVDEHGNAVGVPFALTTGLMDKAVGSISLTSSHLKLTVESPFTTKVRPTKGRLTDADQRARHSGDKGLEFVSDLIQNGKQVVWIP